MATNRESGPGKDSTSWSRSKDRLMLTATKVEGDRSRPPLAVAVERERIALELSRVTIHRLFGIGLKLQALALSRSDSAISDDLGDCVHELDGAITDIRGFIFKMSPRNA